MEWLYTRTMQQEQGELLQNLPIGKGRGNRHKEQEIGNTTYDIYVHFSETSKETFTDRVIRLIRNDAENVDNKM